jgi:phthiodiolone/phenolphthiodiolone dimycocerosates ketoreductase
MAIPIKVGMQVGTQPPLKRVRAMIVAGRTMRLDSLWTVDHFLGFIPQVMWDESVSWMAKPGSRPHAYYDYQVLLGYMAQRAGRIQIGVGVTEPIRRHPVQIAQAFMTLSHLTRRPPILGLGSGEAENVVPYGLDFSRPVSRLEDALAVIRKCFESDGPFDHDGPFYQLDKAVMDLAPAPGRAPEIWIAAHGPRMLEIAGRFGDGWYPTFPMTPSEYGASLDVVKKAAATAGRRPEAIVPSMQIFTVIAPSDAEARELVKGSRAARLLSLLAHDDVFRKAGAAHPLGAGFRGMIDFVPEAYSKDELEHAMAAVPAEILDSFGVAGSPQTVVKQIQALGEAGLRHVVLVPVSALVSKPAMRFTLRSLPGIVRKLRSGK